jgi:hypothetical protein
VYLAPALAIIFSSELANLTENVSHYFSQAVHIASIAFINGLTSSPILLLNTRTTGTFQLISA